MEEKKLMAGLLRTIEKETGETLHPECIDYFFKKWKEDITETAKQDFEAVENNTSEVPLSYAQVKANERQELDYVDSIEKAFIKWDRERNPIQILARDLVEAECSPVTIGHYKEAAKRYMRFVRYEPTLTHEELFAFRNSLQNVSVSTRKWYMAVMKCWWEAMDLVWPIRSRRMHRPHSDVEVEIPSFTTKQVTNVIRLAKKFGTPEIQFYFALVTVFAPRRVELANITQRNFTWQNGTGTLTFVPHKHGKRRTHHIPHELAHYLKYEAKPMPEWLLSRRFTQWCRAIGWTDPKPTKGVRGSWHAFRHGLDTALLEAGIDKTMINSWMGWRSGAQDAPMVGRYYSPEKLDEKILARHPFIRLWAEK